MVWSALVSMEFVTCTMNAERYIKVLKQHMLHSGTSLLIPARLCQATFCTCLNSMASYFIRSNLSLSVWSLNIIILYVLHSVMPTDLVCSSPLHQCAFMQRFRFWCAAFMWQCSGTKSRDDEDTLRRHCAHWPARFIMFDYVFSYFGNLFIWTMQFHF